MMVFLGSLHMLACRFTQYLSPLQKVKYELVLKIEAERPMPHHGLISYKLDRLVQSGASYLSNYWGSLQSDPSCTVKTTWTN